MGAGKDDAGGTESLGGHGVYASGTGGRWQSGVGRLRFAHARLRRSAAPRRWPLQTLWRVLGAARGDVHRSSRRNPRTHRAKWVGQDDPLPVRRRRDACDQRNGRRRTDDDIGAARRKDVLYFVPEGVQPWPDQTVEWVLRFVAGLHGASQRQRDEIVDSRSGSSRCSPRGSVSSRRASTGASCSPWDC